MPVRQRAAVAGEMHITHAANDNVVRMALDDVVDLAIQRSERIRSEAARRLFSSSISRRDSGPPISRRRALKTFRQFRPGERSARLRRTRHAATVSATRMTFD